jgi:chemotaxis family two-component system response regulator PixG
MTQPFALIIEDDPKLGIIFETALQKAGFTTGLDPDGNRFLSFLSTHQPTLILLDMHMPYASGPDILSQLRSDSRWANTPVLIVTADLRMAQSMQAKGEQVLLKPVTVARLTEVVSRYLPKENGQ